ncbi:MAG: hypothetical protein BWX91_00061 [Spirochaetes bacterium ADurb.Bin133]|jgi:hypothetical protein|nr:MAG: hypothetical protein BWX91_00061 [Spirochaetes bacterium ADurb.Bin133]
MDNFMQLEKKLLKTDREPIIRYSSVFQRKKLLKIIIMQNYLLKK